MSPDPAPTPDPDPDPADDIAPLPPAGGLPAHDARRVRRAVLVGVGEARNDPTAQLTDAVALMAAAARAAAADAGESAVLAEVGLVCAMVGSDDAADPAGAARAALGLEAATSVVAAVGVPQQRLVSAAILAVESGRADAVLVLGGEAKASALTARRTGGTPPEVPRGPGADVPLVPRGEFMGAAEVEARLWDPVAQYALIDSALARHEGRSPEELSAEVSALWARFDAVAAHNPDAAFAGPRTAEELATTTEENRLLASPYNKWHSTQWALDHGAALLICSEELADRRGIAAERRLHPLVALESSWGLTLSRRGEPHRWPMMGIMGDVAAAHLGHGVSEVPLAELYSCFPAAVRVQQRELGLPLAGTPTVTGGMAFAGGPFNHFTYMATAALARRLRAGDGDEAVLTTVSGLLTKGGLMVWGREPHPRGALVADVAADAEATTASVPVADFDPERRPRAGDRVVAETTTGGFDPRHVVLLDDPDGLRHITVEPAPTTLLDAVSGC